MKDQYGREINYMRISITDRCNLRCRYCMPHGIKKVPMERILTYEQISEICEAAAGLGITCFRITGGEPLVRLACTDLVRDIRNIPGVKNVTLTTNGILLPDLCEALTDAGLAGVNISLDTLDREKYAMITGFDLLHKTLEGIDAALRCGLRTKVNAVLQRGVNDDGWHDLILLAKDRPIDVRFIELMPIGDAQTAESVSNDELYAKIRATYPDASDDDSVHGNGPAKYIHIPGFSGSVGFISAMHGKFCSSCNRIRLTSKGLLKTCLCYSDSTDLMPVFNENDRGRRRDLLTDTIARSIAGKQREHHFENTGDITEMKKMFEIGG